MKRIIAAAAATLIASLSLAGLTTPRSAAEPGGTVHISTATLTWHHNPSNWPDHWTQLKILYLNASGGTIQVVDIWLKCGPLGDGLWNGPLLNVNGTQLDNGVVQRGGSHDWTKFWEAGDGGNVDTCQQTYHYSPPSDQFDSFTYFARVHWNFTTHYGSGQPDDDVHVNIDMLGRTQCFGFIGSGPGSIQSMSCVANT